MTVKYQSLPIDSLQRGRYQPREHFAEEALTELAQSIKTQGLIEPLIVREIAPHRFEIIAGERRWRAAKQALLSEVPCLIGIYSDEQAAALTLVENIQREDLNLIEEAKGYRRLCDEFHFHQDDIAALVGKSRSHIANILRLLSLSSWVQEHLALGQLSLGHARMLVGLSIAEQRYYAEQVIAEAWSVRVLEEKIKRHKAEGHSVAPEAPQRDVARLQTLLSEQVGAPVQIVAEKGDAGWLQIKFFNNDTLAGLLERMGLRYDE